MKSFIIYILLFLPLALIKPHALLINMIPPENRSKVIFYQENKSTFSMLEGSIHSLQTSYIKQGVIKSSATAIYANGSLIFSDYHGLNSDTVMPIASLTKPFTSFAIMKLAEEGKIDIYAPLSHYLNINPALYTLKDQEVRVIDLLNQTSGIPYDSIETKYANMKLQDTNYSIPLPIYPPGEKFIYSNANYRILSLIIESVTGKKFQDYMKRDIFSSFSMKKSMFGESPNAGASGMASNINDIALFANEMINLKEEGFRFQSGEKIISLFNPPSGIQPAWNMDYYGLGWRVKLRENKLFSFYHTGVWYGSLAVLVIYPQKNAFFIHFSTPPDIRNKDLNDYRWQLDELADRFMAKLPDD